MKYKLITNATLINEGEIKTADILIKNERIEIIAPNIRHLPHWEIFDAQGKHLIPGMIDTHVHFREPGLTTKGTIFSESRAAVAGGVTSFMDMPNTLPNTTSIQLLEEKYSIAAQTSFANYSFYMGINATNIEEALRVSNENVCGLTDDGLYFNTKDSMLCNHPEFLEALFVRTNALVALHCEDEDTIAQNEKIYRSLYGKDIKPSHHALIRSEEACYTATERAVKLALKTNARLHILHLSTEKETHLFNAALPLRDKRITAEACIHHLYFSDKDYERKGSGIKWNPSVKKESDRTGLLAALKNNNLDSISTDHAPHLWTEKSGDYFDSKSGAPSIQHALPALLELWRRGDLSITDIVQKTSHGPAQLFKITDRGFIREGFYADLVLLDLDGKYENPERTFYYKTNWSPFTGENLRASIHKTIINGQVVFDSGFFTGPRKSLRLKFKKER